MRCLRVIVGLVLVIMLLLLTSGVSLAGYSGQAFRFINPSGYESLGGGPVVKASTNIIQEPSSLLIGGYVNPSGIEALKGAPGPVANTTVAPVLFDSLH
jgi:hypothetical protein